MIGIYKFLELIRPRLDRAPASPTRRRPVHRLRPGREGVRGRRNRVCHPWADPVTIAFGITNPLRWGTSSSSRRSGPPGGPRSRLTTRRSCARSGAAPESRGCSSARRAPPRWRPYDSFAHRAGSMQQRRSWCSTRFRLEVSRDDLADISRTEGGEEIPGVESTRPLVGRCRARGAQVGSWWGGHGHLDKLRRSDPSVPGRTPDEDGLPRRRRVRPRGQPGTVVWVDLCGPTVADIEMVGEELGCTSWPSRTPSRHQRPKLDRYAAPRCSSPATPCGSTPAPASSAPSEIAAFITPQALVTVRKDDELRHRRRWSRAGTTSPDLPKYGVGVPAARPARLRRRRPLRRRAGPRRRDRGARGPAVRRPAPQTRRSSGAAFELRKSLVTAAPGRAADARGRQRADAPRPATSSTTR